MPTATPPLYGNPFGDITIGSFRLGDWLVRIEFWIAVVVLLLVIVGLVIWLTMRSKKGGKGYEQEVSESKKHEYEQGKVLYNTADAVAPRKSESSVSEDTLDIYAGGEVTISPFADTEVTVNPFGNEDTVAPDWKAPTVIKFHVNTGDRQYDQEVSFNERMQIGRDESCQLHLKPQYISRHHIELVELPDGIFMRNLAAEKSESYTRLNLAPLGEKMVPIHDGDKLTIAQTSIEIYLTEKQ